MRARTREHTERPVGLAIPHPVRRAAVIAAALLAMALPVISCPAGARAESTADTTIAIPVPPLDSSAAPAEYQLPRPSPSASPAVPAAAAADPNPRPATAHKVRITGEGKNVVREGPGSHFALAGVCEKGAVYPVIAKSGPWYNIRLSDTETAWIHSDLCQEFEDMNDLEFRPNPKLYTRTGTYVLSGYAGGYAFDRKSNSLVFGARLGYYVFDRVQAEAGLSYTHINRPAEIVESLFGLTLEAETFHMLFYNLNLTYEILPGRQMVPFVTVGVGSSIMRGDTEPSFNFGAGTQLFLSKRTATRWEVRNYRFSTGAGTSRESDSNIEFSLATSYLF
jgi:outer membrane beta-barrel protein